MTLTPKGSPSALASEYCPISITPILSKLYEKHIATRLGRYIEKAKVIPSSQYAFCKGLGSCDALLHISHVLQYSLECNSEARVTQIDLVRLLIVVVTLVLFS